MSKELENLEVIKEENEMIKNELANILPTKSVELQEDTSPQPQIPEETDITISELKSKLESGFPINKILGIKKYISIAWKQILIENIISASKEYDENGLARINHCNLELFKAFHIIQAYTNFTFTDEIVNEYDFLAENEIIDSIYNFINYSNEMDLIENLLDREIEQTLKIENSLEGIVAKNLNELQYKIEDVIAKIPDISESKIDQWLKMANKTLTKFKPENLAIVNELYKFAKGEK